MEIPSFSIGVYHQKKVKRKQKKRSSSFYYPSCLFFPFEIYNGPRWKIPDGIHVSESIKYKFSILDTIMSFKKIKHKITENIRGMKVRFGLIYEKQWIPPQNITSQIISFYAKQENEWNRVRAIYFRIFKMQKIMKPLVFRWQVRKCLRNCKNVEDPITLEIPKNPVTIIDFSKRISFVYEANSLKKTIENRLLFSDYMFPEPMAPLNLLTNEPFTLGQIISIIQQCKKHGYVSWVIDSFKSLNLNLQLFSFHNKQKLKIEAIKAFFKKPSYLIRDIVIDYFNLESDYCDLPDSQIARFIVAYDSTPDMPIVQHWIGVTRDYYIAKELNEPILLKRASEKTELSLNMIYKIFQFSYKGFI
jgi:hypothetical protein